MALLNLTLTLSLSLALLTVTLTLSSEWWTTGMAALRNGGLTTCGEGELKKLQHSR